MVRFGVAGYPPAFRQKFNNERYKIFKWLKELGLDTFEMQMTYGPRTSEKKCIDYKNLSEEFGIEITIHGAYYIVLTSRDKKKIKRSIETLKKTFELADMLGAKKIILHPGSLYDEKPDKPLERFIRNAKKFFSEIGETDINLYPEGAGKIAQLGSVNQILEITDKVDKCFPCIDFGHVHGRTRGSLRQKDHIDDLFNKLTDKGAFDQKIHFHYSPVKYGKRGEIAHKALDDRIILKQMKIGEKDKEKFYPRYERIIENIIKHNVQGTIISETFDSQEIGAQRMRDYFKEKK